MNTQQAELTGGLSPFNRRLGYFLMAALSLVGLWAVVLILTRGHELSATTQHVPWGLWVAGYIYLLGLSAGSFLLSTLVYVFGVKRFEAAGPLALLQALVCLILGGFLIIVDLGHPMRVYQVLFSFNATSVMSWMGLYYNFYLLIVLLMLFLAIRPAVVKRLNAGQGPRWLYGLLSLGYTDLAPEKLLRDRAWLKRIGILGLPIAIIVNGGVGVLFAVAKARPNWFSGLFPILFLVSALVSGGALLTFLVAVVFKRAPAEKLNLVRDLARLTIGILCIDWLFFGSEILVTLYGGVPAEAAGWMITLFGPYWWVFWIVQLGLGALVPVFIVASPKLGASVKWLGAAGFLMAAGILGTRLNIVIPPLLTPTFENLPEAYINARNAFGYFPSLNEWLVAGFTLALGFWLFVISFRLLPLEPVEGEES